MLYEFDKTGPANFVFAPDGRHLYGTSYQTGVSNVFRWDFANETMECVTNTDVGFFRPIPDGRLAGGVLVQRQGLSSG